MEDPKQNLRDYLADNGLTLTGGEGLDECSKAKETYTTYITACKVWNALDSSRRFRIKLHKLHRRMKVGEKMQVSDREELEIQVRN